MPKDSGIGSALPSQQKKAYLCMNTSYYYSISVTILHPAIFLHAARRTATELKGASAPPKKGMQASANSIVLNLNLEFFFKG